MFDKWLEKNGLDRKPHQVEGVQFCVGNEKQGRGGLIADEMGLGKTYVMLGTMIENPLNKTLIVLPLALLGQWHKIIKEKCRDLDVYPFHANIADKCLSPTAETSIEFKQNNPKKKGCKAYIRYQEYKTAKTYGQAIKLGMTKADYRHDLKAGYIVNLIKKRIEEADVVITTYGKTLSRKNDSEDDIPNILYEYHWDRLIFDEAHHLRNPGTSRFTGVNKINSKIRWLITGTPIQNRFSDFYALCENMGIKPETYTDESSLTWIAKKYIIKRTKKDAGIELPPVNVHIEKAHWKSEKEQDLSEQIHSLLPFTQVRKESGTIKPSISALGGHSQSILPFLIRARQACIYPELVKKAIEKYIKDGLIDDDPDFLEAINSSSKIDQVIKTIDERKNNGRNKLIFCHFRGEIDIIESKISELGLDVKTFDGRTSHNQRNEILENACDVLILQIQTGCEGLNLQQFSEVYFVSPHWNPAVEDQAIARCHRIGQESQVDVFRFTMDNFGSTTINIENYSNNLQDIKRDIVQDFNHKTAIQEA
jgi:SNF2 family DNA or RNA helicase|tara:strand:- start:887 stop:2494 length:1608 start_codon:yes stop_codon:yes gene_type:complete